MSDDNAQWEPLWHGLRELHGFTRERLILIGSVAVWLHAHSRGDARLPELGQDGDCFIPLGDFAELRDHYETVYAPRADKHQLIRWDVPFDCYVEGYHSLLVSYAAAAAHAVIIDGFRVLALEHLIACKRAAAAARSGAKGERDRRYLECLRRLYDPARDRLAAHGEGAASDNTGMRLPVRIPAPRPLRGVSPINGTFVDLDGLCEAAGIARQVSGGFEPTIRLVDGDSLWRGKNRDGRWVYCISEALLPSAADAGERAWWLLAYLAYGFHDYRARETLARDCYPPVGVAFLVRAPYQKR